MRVCYFGSYDEHYPRNQIIRAGLALNDVEVVQCNVPFLRGGRVWQRYQRLWKQWQAISLSTQIDAIILPEFNHKNLFLAYLIARKARLPLVFDPLVSVYNTNVEDRTRVGTLGTMRDYLLDSMSSKLPTALLADTIQHAAYFSKRWGARPDRLHTVYVGVDEDLFCPDPSPSMNSDTTQTILFFGQYIPLHGTEIIINAFAEIHRAAAGHFRFQMVGRGQTYARSVALAKSLGIATVIDFTPSMPIDRLAKLVAQSTISLGIFGETDKAKRVIPNKVFQAMASGVPVITGDSPAIAELFQNRKHVLTVPFGDAHALASAILELHQDHQLRESVARNGYEIVRRDFCRQNIGAAVKQILLEVIDT